MTVQTYNVLPRILGILEVVGIAIGLKKFWRIIDEIGITYYKIILMLIQWRKLFEISSLGKYRSLYRLFFISTSIINLDLLQCQSCWTNRHLGCFKSAKNFIFQKVQHFRKDSEYLGKINTKKKNQIFYQCLVLPMVPQSFSTYHTMSA